ncbi:MAG TPA: hypothetical protein VKG79_08035 [Bryobacteraceae bacterium]|nr:hypothetical protein [Bryobacteraceae bacterium]
MAHRVLAVNTAAQAENKIHDDQVAAGYGFRGGLVPGVTVYGYMAEPLLTFAPQWLEHGTMQLRLLEPFYDGDAVIVQTEPQEDGSIRITAEREDGKACATGVAGFAPKGDPIPPLIPKSAMPELSERPVPSPETVVPGALLGTIETTLTANDPAALLQLSNDILARNFRLSPWIHIGSEIRNWAAARAGEQLSVRGRVQDRFDRKGHEFIVADVMIVGADDRLIQTVRHTAIYRLRQPEAQAIP